MYLASASTPMAMQDHKKHYFAVKPSENDLSVHIKSVRCDVRGIGLPRVLQLPSFGYP